MFFLYVISPCRLQFTSETKIHPQDPRLSLEELCLRGRKLEKALGTSTQKKANQGQRGHLANPRCRRQETRKRTEARKGREDSGPQGQKMHRIRLPVRDLLLEKAPAATSPHHRQRGARLQSAISPRLQTTPPVDANRRFSTPLGPQRRKR